MDPTQRASAICEEAVEGKMEDKDDEVVFGLQGEKLDLPS